MYLMYLSLFLAYDKHLSHTKVGRKCVCSWGQIEKGKGMGRGMKKGRWGGEENRDRKKITYSVRTAGDLASQMIPEPAASAPPGVPLEMCNFTHYPRFTESESAFKKNLGDLCAYLSSTALFKEWQIQAHTHTKVIVHPWQTSLSKHGTASHQLPAYPLQTASTG